MKTYKSKWVGIRPLIMHNGSLADPLNSYTRQIKDITSKGTKKRTDSDYEKMQRLEWEGALYLDEKERIVLPSDNVERCIQLGAQKQRKGKDVVAGIWCAEGYELLPLKFDGANKKIDELFKSNQYGMTKGVVVNRSRVMRTRPMIPVGWSIEFVLEFDETILSSEDIRKAMDSAGQYVGLGDWRPKFGRFYVEN